MGMLIYFQKRCLSVYFADFVVFYLNIWYSDHDRRFLLTKVVFGCASETEYFVKTLSDNFIEVLDALIAHFV